MMKIMIKKEGGPQMEPCFVATNLHVDNVAW